MNTMKRSNFPETGIHIFLSLQVTLTQDSVNCELEAVTIYNPSTCVICFEFMSEVWKLTRDIRLMGNKSSDETSNSFCFK